MRRKVVLITGANGFLARAVARQMYTDWQLAALIRPGTLPSLHFHTTHDSAERLIAELGRVDAIMHLAACIPSSANPSPPELQTVNVDLVAKLAQAYPDARHVLASSVSAFGTPVSLPLTLQSASHQPTAYGLSKLKAEEVVRQMPNHAIIRFSSLIGVGMKGGTFIPTLVAAARTGTLRLLGDGERLQNYLDIDDAASMCVQAATATANLFVLGIGERSYSNNAVAEMLAAMTGASIVRQGQDTSPSYVYDPADGMDIGRPLIPLRESLRKMVQQT